MEDVKQKLSSLVVADESTPTDVSVGAAAHSLQQPVPGMRPVDCS